MLHIFKNTDTLLASLADLVVKQAGEAIRQHGRFSFVLSGGSSPKKLFELLASDLYRDRISWQQVYFFFGDERNVPADHPDSNYLMARKALFEPLKIADDHIFRMNTDLEPAAAASAYEKDLHTYFAGKPIHLDLVLLGLGDDAHTASLFPHTTALKERESLVKENYVEKVKMYRITLTAPLINAASNIAFLVYGASKATAVHHILEDAKNEEEYPAQLIQPLHGKVHWFLDEAAAAGLKKIRL